MKVVLDTNVLVSALLSPGGTPARIFSLVLNGHLTLLYDNRILGEYLAVLSRPKFGFRRDWIDAVVDFIRHEGHFFVADPAGGDFADEDDRKFFEMLGSGGGEALISGNIRHFPADPRILTPADFLKSYSA